MSRFVKCAQLRRRFDVPLSKIFTFLGINPWVETDNTFLPQSVSDKKVEIFGLTGIFDPFYGLFQRSGKIRINKGKFGQWRNINRPRIRH